jgi:GPH family glycoside/pentoside/hexuronide:cation symporter
VAAVDPPAGELARQAVPQLDGRTKVLYGIGSVANAIKATLFGLFTLYFYTSVMGLSGTLVGIASAAGLAWDALIDPYIGYLSDRADLRFGRRHAFMLVGATTMGLSFWAFFSPPQGLSTSMLFLWLLLTGLLVRTTTSLYAVPFLALGAELSQDYHERTYIAGIRGALALLGTLAAAVLPFVLFFPSTVPGVDPKPNYAGYAAMGLASGLAMTAVGLVTTVSTLPWRSCPRQSDNRETLETRWGFLASSVASLRIPSFRVLFASSSLFFLSIVINSVLTIHFLTYYLRITASSALSALQLSLYTGTLVGVVFWLRISTAVEKRWLYFTATLVTAMAMLSVFFLFGEGHALGIGNEWALRVGYGIVGFFASVMRIVPASMIADVADQDELITGQRREGSFFGIFTFGDQLAAGMSLFVTGVLVDRFAGLVPGQAHQSAQTIDRIAMLYSLLPAMLLILAAVLILRYSLDRRTVEAIQAELERQRRAQHD